jgi:hypothetical protein
VPRPGDQSAKVFCFFSSEKKTFLFTNALKSTQSWVRSPLSRRKAAPSKNTQAISLRERFAAKNSDCDSFHKSRSIPRF